MVRKKNGLLNASLLLLLASVFGMVFGAAATGSNSLQLIRASTEGGDSGGESGGGDGDGGGGSTDPGDGDDGGGNDEPEEPEPPEEPEQPQEPEPDPLPIEPIVPEPVLVQCSDGSQVENADDCPTSTAALAPPAEDLPICNGSPQRCITASGFICEVGQGGHECECAQDMSDCPKHPGIVTTPPVEPKEPSPYCDLVPDDYQGTCHDRRDIDEITGKYPCNDGTQADDWRDCADASVPLPGPSPSPKPCDPVTDPNCDPVVCPANPQVIDGDCVPSECKAGFKLVDGVCDPLPKCPDAPEATTAAYEPICVADDPGENYEPILPNAEDLNCGDPGVPNNIKVIGEDVYGLDGNDNDGIGCETNEGPGPGPGPKPPKCPSGYEYDDGVCEKEITIIINKIIKETNEGKHKNAFPDVDIIGLSVKENGDAMICAMDIDSSHIECQEFAMPENKVNQDFWRVIETDSSKNYDNGNTGSSDIDDAIEDIKSQDFNELEDADNHNFGIDLAWVAINPQGEGVTCLTTDQSGKGKSLCEPFKVSAQDVRGQITEGVEFN
jgi:hypothetical protein